MNSLVSRMPYSPATHVVAPQGSPFKADYYTTGVHDEVAINAAITSLPSQGGSVFLCAGTYTIYASIFINSSNVRLHGASKCGTKLLAHSTMTEYMIDTNPDGSNPGQIGNIEISRMQIECNLTANGIRFYSIASSYIEHNLVHLANNNGLTMDGNYRGSANNNFISFNDFSGSYTGQVVQSPNAEVNFWYGNDFGGSSGTYQFQPGRADKIMQCYVSGGCTYGIYVNYANHIINNHIELSKNSNIYLPAGTHDNVITGNDIYYTSYNNIGLYSDIYVQGVRNIISGNNFNSPAAKYNIEESTSTQTGDNVITGNTHAAFTTAAIFAPGNTAGAGKNIVRDNQGHVTENSGASTIASGTTSIAITHGLSDMPSLKDISVTPLNNLGTATKFWISNPTTTQFTINVDADPGATTARFLWKVSRIQVKTVDPTETLFARANGSVLDEVSSTNGTKGTNATYVTGFYSGTQGLRGSGSDGYAMRFPNPTNFQQGFSIFMIYNTGNMSSIITGSGSYTLWGHTVPGSFTNGFMRCLVSDVGSGVFQVSYDWMNGSGTRSNASIGSSLSDNTWYSHGVTYNGGNAKIYHNGAKIADFGFPNALDYNTYLHIGGDAFSGSDTFKGTSVLCNIIVYNGAISPDAMAYLHNSLTPPTIGILSQVP